MSDGSSVPGRFDQHVTNSISDKCVPDDVAFGQPIDLAKHKSNNEPNTSTAPMHQLPCSLGQCTR